MIILDTNVVSELMKAAPAGRVLGWTAAQPASALYTTSITQAEILHGLALLPAGKRRNVLENAAETMFREDFAGRILPFGSDAARAYARIAADRRPQRPGLRPLRRQGDRPLGSLTQSSPPRPFRAMTMP